MLRCELAVPELLRSYEFSLQEHTPISVLIEEVLSLISSWEDVNWKGDASELILCDVIQGAILPQEKTLEECGVTSGSKLLLM